VPCSRLAISHRDKSSTDWVTSVQIWILVSRWSTCRRGLPCFWEVGYSGCLSSGDAAFAIGSEHLPGLRQTGKEWQPWRGSSFTRGSWLGSQNASCSIHVATSWAYCWSFCNPAEVRGLRDLHAKHGCQGAFSHWEKWSNVIAGFHWIWTPGCHGCSCCNSSERWSCTTSDSQMVLWDCSKVSSSSLRANWSDSAARTTQFLWSFALGLGHRF